MTFFRLPSPPASGPELQGDGLYLRAPELADFEEWSQLRHDSRDFLRPWDPLWPADDLTRPAFRRRLQHYAQERRSDGSYAFLIFRETDDVMLGGITLGHIRRGVAMTGTLGYWIGAEHARSGHMTRAVRLVMRHGFDQFDLRRIEAACIPQNIASVTLLERLGFSREGLAREYLCIAGAWRDHYLYAMLKTEFRR